MERTEEDKKLDELKKHGGVVKKIDYTGTSGTNIREARELLEATEGKGLITLTSGSQEYEKSPMPKIRWKGEREELLALFELLEALGLVDLQHGGKSCLTAFIAEHFAPGGVRTTSRSLSTTKSSRKYKEKRAEIMRGLINRLPAGQYKLGL